MPNSSVEREVIPLSLVSEYGYCPRRCALHTLEQIWEENEMTTAGRIQHEKVHTVRTEKHGDSIYLYEFGVCSRRLGISGKCDCIEAHPSPDGVALPWGEENYCLFPVEYKHGTVRHREEEYHLQLCAQAMCLEEQFGGSIPSGSIFFINSHRRDEIELTPSLRAQTEEVIEQIHALLEQDSLPEAKYGAKCKKCSLESVCQPKLKRTAHNYCQTLWAAALGEDES